MTACGREDAGCARRQPGPRIDPGRQHTAGSPPQVWPAPDRFGHRERRTQADKRGRTGGEPAENRPGKAARPIRPGRPGCRQPNRGAAAGGCRRAAHGRPPHRRGDAPGPPPSAPHGARGECRPAPPSAPRRPRLARTDSPPRPCRDPDRRLARGGIFRGRLLRAGPGRGRAAGSLWQTSSAPMAPPHCGAPQEACGLRPPPSRRGIGVPGHTSSMRSTSWITSSPPSSGKTAPAGSRAWNGPGPAVRSTVSACGRRRGGPGAWPRLRPRAAPASRRTSPSSIRPLPGRARAEVLPTPGAGSRGGLQADRKRSLVGQTELRQRRLPRRAMVPASPDEAPGARHPLIRRATGVPHQRAVASSPPVCSGVAVSRSIRVAFSPKLRSGA